MAKLFLSDKFKQLWQGKDPFAQVDALEGEEYRALEGRRTFRTVVDGVPYFVKQHKGVGWGEIFKNLLQLKLPVLGARNEWLAIRRLQEVGVGTMTASAYGERGWNPARKESFIITEALEPTVSLEDYCAEWPTNYPDIKWKRLLLNRVAEMSRRLHEGGVNHRDFYLCHFLLDVSNEPSTKDLKLSLIDLHRSQIRSKVPFRWRLKDLAGLYFSSFGVPLTQRDKFRFIQEYTKLPLREALEKHKKLWTAMEKKAAKVYARDARKGRL